MIIILYNYFVVYHAEDRFINRNHKTSNHFQGLWEILCSLNILFRKIFAHLYSPLDTRNSLDMYNLLDMNGFKWFNLRGVLTSPSTILLDNRLLTLLIYQQINLCNMNVFCWLGLCLYPVVETFKLNCVVFA